MELKTRLRELERANSVTWPLVLVVDKTPTERQKQEIAEARRRGRAVVLLTPTDARL